MQFRYTAYDFDIRSEIELPARALADEAPGLEPLTIRYDETLAERPWAGFDFRMSQYMEFSIIGPERWLLRSFDGSSGREALVEVDAAGSIGVFCRGGWLLGDLGRLTVYQGLTALAFLRNSAVLHGSMLHHNGRGFAILGSSGNGKSTTTAALLHAGATLVAEESLVLRHTADGDWNVLPGLPHLSLDPSLLPRLHPREVLPEWEFAGWQSKVRWRWQTEESPLQRMDHVPLQSVFLLEPRQPGQASLKTTLLDTPNAVQELVQHAYWSVQLPPAYRAASYRAAMQIATTLPVYRVSLPDTVDRLFAQAPGLLHEFSQLAQPRDMTHA